MEHRVQVDVSPEIARSGTFANFVNIWHDADGFTLDFAVHVQPAQVANDAETGQPYVHRVAHVVSRVRIPPSQVFEIMKALEQQLSAWESETGRRPPGAETP
jgi:hypothetical protein